MTHDEGTDERPGSGDGELPFNVGWATSIGSLPHTDPVAAARFVLERQPDLPAAPSLPQRSPLEGMLPQALWGMAGVTIDAGDGAITVDTDKLDPTAPLGDPALEGEPFVGLHAFLEAVRGRTAPIKAQVTGPVTLGLAISMYGVDEELAFRLALDAVRQRARALLARLAEAAPDAPLVVFLDEPALVGTAQLGFPLATNDIIDLVSGALAVIEPEAVTGVHCCGEADWKAIIMAGPQVLSLPVGAGVTAAAGAIGVFLDRGGWIAWGAVPTERADRRAGRDLLEVPLGAVVRAGSLRCRPRAGAETVARHPVLRPRHARRGAGGACARLVRQGRGVAAGAGGRGQAFGGCLSGRAEGPAVRFGSSLRAA